MILVDTNIFIAFLNSRDKNHLRAKKLVRLLRSGEYGGRFTISEVFTETANYLIKRTKRIELVVQAWDLIYTEESALVQPLIIKKEDIDQAWIVFHKYTSERRPLSFVDCLLIAVSQEYRMDSIVSFDSEFDGILNRVY